MDDDSLTLEQAFLLQRVRLEAQDLDRDKLIDALCAAWEVRFRGKQAWLSMARQAGLLLQLEERHPWQPPKTRAAYERWLGYMPNATECEALLKHQQELATMELDMEAIVLTPDEDG